MRQGIDDFRYLVTLDNLVARALKSKSAEVREAGRKVRSEMQKLKNEMPFFFTSEWDVRNFDRYRWRIATMGEFLQSALEGKKVLPEVKFFAAEAKKKSNAAFPVILQAPEVAPITIDGDLGDPSWSKAFRVPQMALLSGNKPEVPTDIFLARDKNYLYIGFRNVEPDVSKITGKHKHRDIFTWRDDSVEIFYDAANDHYSRRHLMFNAINGVTDIAIEGKKSDIKWNCPGLKSAAAIGKGMWCCEVAIPLKEFPSAVSGINFMRNRINLLSHASLVPTPHEPRNYAKLLLEDAPARLAPIAKPLLGRNIIPLELKEKAKVTVTVEGKKQYETVLSTAGTVPVDLSKEGFNKYAVTVTPLAGTKKSVTWSFNDELPKAMVIDQTAAYYFVSEKFLTVKGSINMNLVKGDGTALEVKMSSGSGQTLFQKTAEVTGNDLVFTLPLERFAPEESYTVEFTLLLKGQKAGSVKRSFYLMKSM